jgi:hypothetical protein
MGLDAEAITPSTGFAFAQSGDTGYSLDRSRARGCSWRRRLRDGAHVIPRGAGVSVTPAPAARMADAPPSRLARTSFRPVPLSCAFGKTDAAPVNQPEPLLGPW